MKSEETKLVQRYKTNYGIAAESLISAEMILRHGELEKNLRRELLDSKPENRWEVFATCYGRLYRELEWLNRLGGGDEQASPAARYRNWLEVIGSPPQAIYEVGSGKGELICYLAQCGFMCKATEITQERGQRWTAAQPNLTWGRCDGVHLDRFEPAGCYDAVVSDQVIEHLHPDDMAVHFKAVRTILKEGGRYIFSTPHAIVGPSDVSRVFLTKEPAGMHLKEYDYGEIFRLLKQSGFASAKSVVRLPATADRLIGHPLRARASAAYLFYLCGFEKLLGALPGRALRRRAAQLSRLALFAPEIFLVAQR